MWVLKWQERGKVMRSRTPKPVTCSDRCEKKDVLPENRELCGGECRCYGV